MSPRAARCPVCRRTFRRRQSVVGVSMASWMGAVFGGLGVETWLTTVVRLGCAGGHLTADAIKEARRTRRLAVSRPRTDAEPTP